MAGLVGVAAAQAATSYADWLPLYLLLLRYAPDTLLVSGKVFAYKVSALLLISLSVFT